MPGARRNAPKQRHHRPMLKLQTPNGDTRVLLHSCCAPCSSAIIECMLTNHIRPTVFYCNPNIYPPEEYEIRKQEAIRFVTSQGLDFVDAEYDHTLWQSRMKGFEEEPERGRRPAMPPRMASPSSPPPWPPRVGKAWSKSMKRAERPPHATPAPCSGNRTGGKAACKSGATSCSANTASTTSSIADASSACGGWRNSRLRTSPEPSQMDNSFNTRIRLLSKGLSSLMACTKGT